MKINYVWFLLSVHAPLNHAWSLPTTTTTTTRGTAVPVNGYVTATALLGRMPSNAMTSKARGSPLWVQSNRDDFLDDSESSDGSGMVRSSQRRVKHLMDRSETLREQIQGSPYQMSFVWLSDQLISLTSHLRLRYQLIKDYYSADRVDDLTDAEWQKLDWLQHELQTAEARLEDYGRLVASTLRSTPDDDALQKELRELASLSEQIQQALSQSTDKEDKREVEQAYARAQSSLGRLNELRRDLNAVETALNEMEKQDVFVHAIQAEDVTNSQPPQPPVGATPLAVATTSTSALKTVPRQHKASELVGGQMRARSPDRPPPMGVVDQEKQYRPERMQPQLETYSAKDWDGFVDWWQGLTSPMKAIHAPDHVGLSRDIRSNDSTGKPVYSDGTKEKLLAANLNRRNVQQQDLGVRAADVTSLVPLVSEDANAVVTSQALAKAVWTTLDRSRGASSITATRKADLSVAELAREWRAMEKELVAANTKVSPPRPQAATSATQASVSSTNLKMVASTVESSIAVAPVAPLPSPSPMRGSDSPPPAAPTGSTLGSTFSDSLPFDTSLYEVRTQKVASAAAAGKSRWGDMENQLATILAQQLSEGPPDFKVKPDRISSDVARPTDTSLYDKRTVSVAQAAAAGRSRWGTMENERATMLMEGASSTGKRQTRIQPDRPGQGGFSEKRLYDGRTQQVAAAAKAGTSRWGNMENDRAKVLAESANSNAPSSSPYMTVSDSSSARGSPGWGGGSMRDMTSSSSPPQASSGNKSWLLETDDRSPGIVAGFGQRTQQLAAEAAGMDFGRGQSQAPQQRDSWAQGFSPPEPRSAPPPPPQQSSTKSWLVETDDRSPGIVSGFGQRTQQLAAEAAAMDYSRGQSSPPMRASWQQPPPPPPPPVQPYGGTKSWLLETDERSPGIVPGFGQRAQQLAAEAAAMDYSRGQSAPMRGSWEQSVPPPDTFSRGSSLYDQRSERVAASASAGQSRWGNMENARAQNGYPIGAPELIGPIGPSESRLYGKRAEESRGPRGPSEFTLYGQRTEKVAASAYAGKSRWGTMGSDKAQTGSFIGGARPPPQDTSLYERRSEHVAAAAAAGMSRWGTMENEKAKSMASSPSTSSGASLLFFPETRGMRADNRPGIDSSLYDQRTETVAASSAAGRSKWGQMENEKAKYGAGPRQALHIPEGLDFIPPPPGMQGMYPPEPESDPYDRPSPVTVVDASLFEQRNQRVAQPQGGAAGQSRWGTMETEKVKNAAGLRAAMNILGPGFGAPMFPSPSYPSFNESPMMPSQPRGSSFMADPMDHLAREWTAMNRGAEEASSSMQPGFGYHREEEVEIIGPGAEDTMMQSPYYDEPPMMPLHPRGEPGIADPMEQLAREWTAMNRERDSGPSSPQAWAQTFSPVYQPPHGPDMHPSPGMSQAQSRGSSNMEDLAREWSFINRADDNVAYTSPTGYSRSVYKSVPETFASSHDNFFHDPRAGGASHDSLYDQRNEQVSSAASAGQSRWGTMENESATSAAGLNGALDLLGGSGSQNYQQGGSRPPMLQSPQDMAHSSANFSPPLPKGSPATGNSWEQLAREWTAMNKDAGGKPSTPPPPTPRQASQLYRDPYQPFEEASHPPVVPPQSKGTPTLDPMEQLAREWSAMNKSPDNYSYSYPSLPIQPSVPSSGANSVRDLAAEWAAVNRQNDPSMHPPPTTSETQPPKKIHDDWTWLAQEWARINSDSN